MSIVIVGCGGFIAGMAASLVVFCLLAVCE
jgi:hypothetical protein